MPQRRLLVDVQTLLVCLAGLLAAAYLARGLWRTWAGKGCGSCGSSATKKSQANLIPAEDLLVRVRQGNGAGKRRDVGSTDCGKSESFST
jgi:hypothetical protein